MCGVVFFLLLLHLLSCKRSTERTADSPVSNVWHVVACVFMQATTPQSIAAVLGHSPNRQVADYYCWLVYIFRPKVEIIA